MMRKIGFFGLIAIIVFFLLVGVSSFMKETPRETQSINYTFSIKDGVGINLDTDKLNFGGGTPGMSLQRNMNISSLFDSFVHIESIGPGNLILSSNDFYLPANTSMELLFGINVPNNLPLGKYEGTVFFYFYEQ